MVNFSPRVILVAQEGRIAGLVTVKDVLRHEAAVEHSAAQRRSTGNTSAAGDTTPMDWRDRVWNEDAAAGLEIVLEEGLLWAKRVAFKGATLASRTWDQIRGRPMTSRGGGWASPAGAGRGETLENEAEEYELREE